MQPQVTVVVPTYRRPDVLETAVESLLRQTLPPEQYEVVVVDNDSDRAVRELIQRLSSVAAVRVWYHAEPRLGLCHARNAGIVWARGEVVAFMDDDAEAEVEWLERLLVAFKDTAVWVAGGRIKPIWNAERPDWLDDSMLRGLSLIDWGEAPRALEWPERVIGTNMAVRRAAFETVGRFDPRLDRRGNALLGHGDTEIQERVHRVGKRVAYLPDAIVHHQVPAERLTKHYFYRRFYGAGRSKAILVSRKGMRALLREIRRHLRLIGEHGLALLADASIEKERFLAARQVAHCCGFVHQGLLLLPGKLLERAMRLPQPAMWA